MTLKSGQISLLSVAIGLIFGLVTMADGQVSDTYYNLYLEAKVNPYEPTLDITEFEFNHTQICPSVQCKILYDKNPSGDFSGPDIPESNLINSRIEFTVQDDIGHVNLGEKEKAFIERYIMDITCVVNDIVEDNGPRKILL